MELIETNYSKAWKTYTRTKEYRQTAAILIKKNITQPYLDNLLRCAFNAGWAERKIIVEKTQPKTVKP